MNIPNSNVISVGALDHHVSEVKAEPGKWTQLLNAVKNSADNFSSLRPQVTSFTQSATRLCEALGMSKMIKGLAWVGNAYKYAEQAHRKAADIAQVVKTGMNIAQYGVTNLGHSIASSLKRQAVPIVKCTLGNIIEAGPDVTKGQALSGLMKCIIANPEIDQLIINLKAR